LFDLINQFLAAIDERDDVAEVAGGPGSRVCSGL
jgi:hypothetical protein